MHRPIVDFGVVVHGHVERIIDDHAVLEDVTLIIIAISFEVLVSAIVSLNNRRG